MPLGMAAIFSRTAAVHFPAVLNSGRSMVTTARPPCTRRTRASKTSRSLVWLPEFLLYHYKTLQEAANPPAPYLCNVNIGTYIEHCTNELRKFVAEKFKFEDVL
jgi:hypothetical protein